jgi:hypothetical protein
LIISHIELLNWTNEALSVIKPLLNAVDFRVPPMDLSNANSASTSRRLTRLALGACFILSTGFMLVSLAQARDAGSPTATLTKIAETISVRI